MNKTRMLLDIVGNNFIKILVSQSKALKHKSKNKVGFFGGASSPPPVRSLLGETLMQQMWLLHHNMQQLVGFLPRMERGAPGDQILKKSYV